MSPQYTKTLHGIADELAKLSRRDDMSGLASGMAGNLAAQLKQFASSGGPVTERATEERCAGVSGALSGARAAGVLGECGAGMAGAAVGASSPPPSTEELLQRLHDTMGQLAARSQEEGQHNARLASIGAKIDQFEQFCRGPIADGDLVSKDARDRLLRQQLIVRENGFNALSADGLRFATALGLIRS